jgi:hypothetical protein
MTVAEESADRRAVCRATLRVCPGLSGRLLCPEEAFAGA